MKRLLLLAVILGLTAVLPAARVMAAGTVTGTVTYEGTPMPGISVYLCQSQGGVDDYLCLSVETGPNGVYTFTSATAGDGNYLYTAPSGYHPVTFYPHAYWEPDAETFTIVDGASTTRDISLLIGGIISGKVTVNGKPVHGALVSCNSGQYDDRFRHSRADGTYQLLPVLPGEYRCHALTSYHYYDNKNSWETADKIVVNANQTNTDINFNITFGSPVVVVPLSGE